MTPGTLLPAPVAMSSTASLGSSNRSVKHKRRYCRAPGCTRIVKSQGLCQRHGAKPRKCKVESCDKQAQGNFDGMCKSHFKASKRAAFPPPTPIVSTIPSSTLDPPIEIPNPEGESVYDHILPSSIAWHASSGHPMPLIKHLKDGFDAQKPPAWHRNEERQARGLFAVINPAAQLEGWERELVWMEILILTGNPESSFRHLARGWGRDKGFHMVLAQFICERRGNVERKKREKNAARTRNVNGGYEEECAVHIGRSGHPANHYNYNLHSHHHHHHLNSYHPNLGGHAGQDIWDDNADNIACYGDAAYNEALAVDLLTFHSPSGDSALAEKRLLEGSFSFDHDGEASYDSSLISSSEDGFDDSEPPTAV